MQFLPWLMNTSLAHLRQAIVARHIIDELLRSSLTARLADMEWLDAQFEFVKTSHDEAVCTPVEPPYPYFFTEADWVGYISEYRQQVAPRSLGERKFLFARLVIPVTW